jgi:hypothetical protein
LGDALEGMIDAASAAISRIPMTRTRLLSFAVALSLVAPAIWAAPPAGTGPKATERWLMGRYSFHLKPAVSFAPFYSDPSGRDSGVLSAPRQDILRVGTFYADGRGNVTGHTIATTDDGLTTIVIDFEFSGTYTVNDDGTGSLSIEPGTITDTNCTPAPVPPGTCVDFEGPETFAFVINRHGAEKLVSLIQTDNEGGGAKIFLTGEARRQ